MRTTTTITETALLVILVFATTLTPSTTTICHHQNCYSGVADAFTLQVPSTRKLVVADATMKIRATMTKDTLLSSSNKFPSPSLLRLFSSSFDVNVETPTQEEAEALGIREWPQQARPQGAFQEISTSSDTTTSRYVLDGLGQLTVVSTTKTSPDSNKRIVVPLRPGTLVEVTGDAEMTWDVTSEEMIILTPEYEQIGVFLGVLAGLIVLVGILVSLS